MHDVRGTAQSLAQRKQQLIDEGAQFRQGISQSRHLVRNSLAPASLARNVIGHLFGALGAGAGGFSLQGLNLQKVLPLAIGGLSFLSRRALLKPALKAGMVIGAIAGIAALVRRGRRRKAQGRIVAADSVR